MFQFEILCGKKAFNFMVGIYPNCGGQPDETDLFVKLML